MKKVLLGVLVGILLVFGGCRKPYDKPEFITIGSEETAFVIPLEGENKDSQVKLDSVEYVETLKVAQKRIRIPHKWVQTGRRHWSGEYMNTIAVMKVKRTPISREWLDSATKGTSTNDDSFKVESADSVTFFVGGTLQAMIQEKDTAKFFYFYRATKLENIADRDIRPFIAKILAREFGKMNTENCRLKKGDVFEIAEREAKNHFKQFGITITSFGLQGDITYANIEIQNQINRKAQMELASKIAEEEKKKRLVEERTLKEQAIIQEEKKIEMMKKEKEKRLIEEQMKIELAQKALEEQRIINKKEKEIADKELYIAQQKQKVIETTKELVKLDIEKIKAQADLEKSQRWNGVVPTLVPENARVVMGLDKTLSILDLDK